MVGAEPKSAPAMMCYNLVKTFKDNIAFRKVVKAMLNRRKKPLHSPNREGSVLLAVVVVSMFVLCLATICLHVVRYTAQATSRNVQRTQAKITAEAALTEFINGYKANQQSSSSYDPNHLYDELQSIAANGTKASPVVYKVGMSGETDDEFSRNFGATEIHLYGIGGSSFKAEAITTFVTQTQTASIQFASVTTIKPVSSNTIESKKGTVLSNEEQLSNPVDGNIVYENDDGAIKTYKRMSRSIIRGHVYSEMSIMCDDQTTITDLLNKSGDNIYKKDYRYFTQAPTFTVDGYLATQNTFFMYTNVGKSDIDKANSSYQGGAYAYPKNNELGNYDGYLCVYKKLLALNGHHYCIGGKPSNPNDYADVYNNKIDVYTHGFYGGDTFDSATLDSADGTVSFANDITTVKEAYDYNGAIVDSSSQSDKVTVNGNFYSYVEATAAPNTHSGDIVIAQSNSNSAQRILNVKGDVYCDGKIYIYCGDYSTGVAPKVVFKVDGKLHASGGVYYKDGGEWKACNPLSKAELLKIGVEVGDVDTDVTQTGRNMMPKKGYIPYTGDGMTEESHTHLKNTYDLASTNDIFTMSASATDGNIVPKNKSANKVLKAQDISSKYADAMTRDFDSTFKASDGTQKRVVQVYSDDHTETGKYYQINSSVKLSAKQARSREGGTEGVYNKYIVNVTDQDIVIALPISKDVKNHMHGMTFNGLTVEYTCEIGAKFKIFVNDPVNNPHYVYFMFYLEDRPEECLYINCGLADIGGEICGINNNYITAPSVGVKAGDTVHLETTDGQPYDVVAAKVPVGKYKTDSTTDLFTAIDNPNSRRGMVIEFYSLGGQWIASDYRLLVSDSSRITAGMTAEQIKNAVISSFNDGTSPITGGSFENQYVPDTGRLIDNYIMWLIPDYVTCKLSGSESSVRVQGVLYAWNSQFNMGHSGQARWVGQIKVDRYCWDENDASTTAKMEPMIIDLPMAGTSLLSYAGDDSGAATPSKIDIQYYQY